MLLRKKSFNIEPKSYQGNGYSLFYNQNGLFLFDTSLQEKELLSMYSKVEPLNTALNVKADAIKSVEPYLFDNNSQEFTQENDFIQLLMNPSYNTNYGEFMTEIVLHKTLVDNYYLVVNAVNENSEPLSIEVARPDTVSVVSTSNIDGLPFQYQQTDNSTTVNYFREGLENPRYFNSNKTKELLHWNGINITAPSNQYKGNNGINAIYIQCLKFLKVNQYNVGLLDNGVRPSGAMVLKSKDGCNATLSQEQFDRLKEQIEVQYSGTANSGKPLLLDGGLEWQPMNMSNKDMDFLDGIKFDSKSIIRNIKIPLTLVGEQTTTFNGYPEARISLYQDLAIPETKEIFGFLFNNIAIPRYKNIDKLQLVCKEDEIVPLEKEKRAGNIEIVKLARTQGDQILTVNEQRKLLGFDDIEEEQGDKVQDENEQEKAQFIKLLKKSGAYTDSEILNLSKNYDSL